MRILSSGIFIDQRDPRSRRDHLPSAYRRLYLLERHAPEPAHGYARAHMCDEQRGLAAGALAWARKRREESARALHLDLGVDSEGLATLAQLFSGTAASERGLCGSSQMYSAG